MSTSPRLVMDTTAPPAIVTSEQRELVRRTIAADATDDELALFFYDCSRLGVHPLDRLLHFTKRKGKYTPIASIDLLRTRAADTNECLGISDALFAGTQGVYPAAATVTVKRLVASQVAEFSATARWREYYPGDGDPGFMWRRMPHVMLGKCAEALALRKGFPKQLSGLYAKEELDQVDTLSVPPPGTPPPAGEQGSNTTLPVVERPPASAVASAPPAPARRGRPDPERTPWSDAQRKMVFAVAADAGWSRDVFKERLAEAFGLDEARIELRKSEVDAALSLARRGPPSDSDDGEPGEEE